MANDIIQYSSGMLDPIVQLVNSFIVNVPGIVGAVALIILGYLLGVVLGDLVKKILDKAKLDPWLEKMGRSHPLGKLTVAELCGKLVKWYVFIAFLATAANFIQLVVLARLLTDFALWAPHLLMAVIFMAFGLILSEFALQEIASLKLGAAKLVGIAAKYFVIIFFAIYALREIGLNVFLAEATFLILIGGIVLALAIGFGLGMQRHVEQVIGDLRKNLK